MNVWQNWAPCFTCHARNSNIHCFPLCSRAHGAQTRQRHRLAEMVGWFRISPYMVLNSFRIQLLSKSGFETNNSWSRYRKKLRVRIFNTAAMHGFFSCLILNAFNIREKVKKMGRKRQQLKNPPNMARGEMLQKLPAKSPKRKQFSQFTVLTDS